MKTLVERTIPRDKSAKVIVSIVLLSLFDLICLMMVVVNAVSQHNAAEPDYNDQAGIVMGIAGALLLTPFLLLSLRNILVAKKEKISLDERKIVVETKQGIIHKEKEFYYFDTRVRLVEGTDSTRHIEIRDSSSSKNIMRCAIGMDRIQQLTLLKQIIEAIALDRIAEKNDAK
ncbi:MAG: hypothetical protein K5864_08125 [Bacteroidales bacterium]|nr:hypothetical protein [Bacteroidales bacterium]